MTELEIFKEISLPFLQSKKDEVPEVCLKKEKIEEILFELKLNTYHDDKNYLMYTKGNLEEILNNKYYVFVAHIDLIKSFHKGFLKNRECYIEKDEEKIIGALDNTLPNAILIKAMLEVDYKDNVIFLFTYGEEKGMWGIDNFMKSIKENVDNGTFINLDVTNEGYDKSISIEYDEPNYSSMIKLIDNYNDKHSIYYTVDRMCDDCDVILSNGGNGLSVCLPTKGIIHSWENETTVSKILGYSKFISEIVKNPFKLKNGKDQELTFKNIFELHKGNQKETLKLIKDEEKKIKKERKERMKLWKNSERKTGSYNYNNEYSLFDYEDNRFSGYTSPSSLVGERHEFLTYVDILEDLASFDENIDSRVTELLSSVLRSENLKEHEHIPMDIVFEELLQKKELLKIDIDEHALEQELYSLTTYMIEMGLIDEAQMYAYDTMFFNESVLANVNLDTMSDEVKELLSID